MDKTKGIKTALDEAATLRYIPRTVDTGKLAEFLYRRGITAVSEETSETESRSILLEDLDLSVRTYNALKRAGINNTAQLCEMGAGKLRTIRNLGTKAFNEVIDRCAEFGITI